jgi:ABC-type Fe3+-hydroxamate transport system substrate-binding protein
MTVSVSDDRARTLKLTGVPRRVVSLVPSVTELVCKLGCARTLVGVTRHCTEPPEIVGGVEKVGGPKDPVCGRIIALAPDVVLLSTEENRREDFERLTGAGVEVFVLEVKGVEEAAKSVERVGALLGQTEAAGGLALEIRAVQQLLASAACVRRRVFCPVWREPWISFNGQTFAHDLLRCAGGDNVCGSARSLYPKVDLTEVARRDPEVILLPDEPYRFTERDKETMLPLACTSAWKKDRIHLVDGRLLFWYGSRTPAALLELSNLLRWV